MSINHFSSDLPFMEPNWLSPYNRPQPSPSFLFPNPTLNFNFTHQEDDEELDDSNTDNLENHQEDQDEEQRDREPMFQKPLTPSDVGKLNRLVIPKQHAEKYFPLGGSDSADKGLLLSFEDEMGKCWRFRYSYWNSSQSYVLTKGWSRYVKEKRLDAGDVVLFERHRRDSDRLFIGWRRRAVVLQDSSEAVDGQTSGGGGGGGGQGWSRVIYPAHPYPTHHGYGLPVPYQPDSIHAGAECVAQNQTTPAGNSKRLRLFGVNMECQLDESEPSDGTSFSSHGQTHWPQYSSSNPS